MKYYIKNLRTGEKSRPFGSKEALESYISEFSDYRYDYNDKKYKYVGNSLLDKVVGKKVSEYNKNLKKVRQLIEANATIFYLPDCLIKVSRKEWRLDSLLRGQIVEEAAIEALMSDSVMREGLYSRFRLYIKGSILIVNEKGGIYDYTDFLLTSRREDSEYFKRVYEETKKKYVVGTYYNWRWSTSNLKIPEFRKEAVPFTGHYKHYRRRRCGVSGHERWLDVENVREYEEDIEYAVKVKGIRSKRKRIYAGCCSMPANHPSWKEKRCKKQWMRGDKGIKTIEKRVYIDDEENSI